MSKAQIIEDPKYGKMIRLPLKDEPKEHYDYFSFGLKKAKLILRYIEDIKIFVNESEQNKGSK